MKGYMKVSLLFVFILAFVVACGTTNDGDNQQTNDEQINNNETDANENNNNEVNHAGDEDGAIPLVTITMENGGEIKAELYPHIAPDSVNNFISLIQDGYYDGVIFHRVIPGFMIQGGDPQGTGMGGPGYSIKGEFASNGFENNLLHERGILSMARSNHPDSAGSQFFIMVADAPHLDGEYASFGKVVEGMEVADEIVAVDRDGNDRPSEEQVIEKVTVELNGYEPADFDKLN